MKPYYLVILITFFISSCGFLKTPPSNEPDLGEATKKFEVNIQGDELYKLIGLSLTSDTVKNLFNQLGHHGYSTSRDFYYPYATTGMYLYYEFGDLRFSFNGPDAGSNEKSKVENLIKKYPDGYRLEQIEIRTPSYKGTLPKGINDSLYPNEVEKILGKYDEHFGRLDPTQRIKYFYPNHGLTILFNTTPVDIHPDSSIFRIWITDSITEMKRFPTKFPGR